jgi:hypothetical protein
LATQVIRVQDDAIVSEGTHRVWIPGYLTMWKVKIVQLRWTPNLREARTMIL